jgi:hypothetical protein
VNRGYAPAPRVLHLGRFATLRVWFRGEVTLLVITGETLLSGL